MNKNFYKDLNRALCIEFPVYIGFRLQDNARYQDYQVGKIVADSAEDARVQIVELLRNVASEIERGHGQ